jgi:hypothetical protein
MDKRELEDKPMAFLYTLGNSYFVSLYFSCHI